MSIKKRGAVYSVIALMLCAAVYLNWNYTKNENEESTTVASEHTVSAPLLDGIMNTGSSADDYFANARLSREKARDEAVNILNETIGNINAADEAIETAGLQIRGLAENSVTESRIESLVIAKGYKDCVSYVNDNSVNVIVAKTEEGLSDADVARIRDIVMDEAGVTADKIKIIEAD